MLQILRQETSFPPSHLPIYRQRVHGRKNQPTSSKTTRTAGDENLPSLSQTASTTAVQFLAREVPSYEPQSIHIVSTRHSLFFFFIFDLSRHRNTTMKINRRGHSRQPHNKPIHPPRSNKRPPQKRWSRRCLGAQSVNQSSTLDADPIESIM